MAHEVIEQDPSDSVRWIAPIHPSHLGDDLIPSVPPGRTTSVQPIDGRENLDAANSPGPNPVGDREIKGRRRQPLVSEE